MHRDPITTTLATDLRIAAISPQPQTLETLRNLIDTGTRSGNLVLVPGTSEAAAAVASKERPDVLVVEGTRHDASDLLALEPVVAQNPGIAVMLLSKNQSPEFLRMGMRIGLREVLPLPIASEVLFEAILGVRQRIAGSSRAAGRLVSFAGCKGGSGTSFLASNVAYAAAARHSCRVALIDLNRMFGDACFYISERAPVSTLADVARGIERLDGPFLASSMVPVLPNLHALAAPEEPEQALHILPQHVDALLEVALANYDLVVVDCGAALDELAVRALDRSESVFMVMQLGLPFLRHAKRIVRALDDLGYGREKVRLVVNRFEKHRGAVTSEDVERALKRPVSWSVPNSFNAVADSVNQGMPVCKLAPRDAVSRSLEALAAELLQVEHEAAGWLKGLLARRT
jgi:pilus assembly protein CpaE